MVEAAAHTTVLVRMLLELDRSGEQPSPPSSLQPGVTGTLPGKEGTSPAIINGYDSPRLCGKMNMSSAACQLCEHREVD